jgi:hypothetical protein
MNNPTFRRLKQLSLLLLFPVGLFVFGVSAFTFIYRQEDLPEQQGHPFQQTNNGWWKPAPGTSWQWQLNGEIDPTLDVQMYNVDLFEAPQEVIDQLHARGLSVGLKNDLE